MLLEHCKTWNRLALVNTDHKWQKPPECSFFVHLNGLDVILSGSRPYNPLTPAGYVRTKRVRLSSQENRLTY